MILPLIPSVIFINLFYSTTISALPHLLPRQTDQNRMDQTVQQYLDTAMQFVSEPQTGISSPNSQVTTPEPQKTDIFDVPASGMEGVTKHLLNNILLCEDRSVVVSVQPLPPPPLSSPLTGFWNE